MTLNLNRWGKCLACAILALMCNTVNAQAGITEHLAVRAIIGEASSEGYRGMLAVAEAIRNRGHLRQVYGVNAKHISRESERTWELARKAWKESERSNIVKGATIWGNKKDVDHFRKQRWFKRCVQVAQVGGHRFYKEVQRP